MFTPSCELKSIEEESPIQEGSNTRVKRQARLALPTGRKLSAVTHTAAAAGSPDWVSKDLDLDLYPYPKTQYSMIRDLVSPTRMNPVVVVVHTQPLFNSVWFVDVNESLSHGETEMRRMGQGVWGSRTMPHEGKVLRNVRHQHRAKVLQSLGRPDSHPRRGLSTGVMVLLDGSMGMGMGVSVPKGSFYPISKDSILGDNKRRVESHPHPTERETRKIWQIYTMAADTIAVHTMAAHTMAASSATRTED
ncbi:hypothetical protein F5876DRAFT_69668 [Lentinula aff. lateritia]|uniref:Uncharacterized protein n=1 Tax=Lentinula aff. lateritia TaxID=2804960 RepID=A0ACC1TLU3_9AGAR|nr:hypothetical protein F5876DRAFT_69668 [Lentinula aff. lateritia]